MLYLARASMTPHEKRGLRGQEIGKIRNSGEKKGKGRKEGSKRRRSPLHEKKKIRIPFFIVGRIEKGRGKEQSYRGGLKSSGSNLSL